MRKLDAATEHYAQLEVKRILANQNGPIDWRGAGYDSPEACAKVLAGWDPGPIADRVVELLACAIRAGEES